MNLVIRLGFEFSEDNIFVGVQIGGHQEVLENRTPPESKNKQKKSTELEICLKNKQNEAFICERKEMEVE